ncbi:MAG: hypothetical protein IPL25_14625 [Saprospiraceae bacterium]|nr:hypothetical protein [Candidatus Vicinibacter affinis]
MGPKLLAILFIVSIISHNKILAQYTPTISIKTYYEGFLINSDNPILIIARQKQPIILEQVSAFFQSYNENSYPLEIYGNNGNFYIHPDSLGWVTITVKTETDTLSENFRTRQIPAIGYLSGHRANRDEKISVNDMKTQLGLIPVVECCGFDIKCNIKSFETILISTKNKVFKTKNNGGRFNDETLKIIKNTRSGDIYIFRNIKYRCPGDIFPQRLDDMTFEVE